MESLRKLFAILLLALMGLPFASSLLALTPKDDARLPACCRRSGQHHCMQAMGDHAPVAESKTEFSAPLAKCPYCPATLPGVNHPVSFGIPAGDITFTALAAQATAVPQAESKRRISRDRSRQKRGPPYFSI